MPISGLDMGFCIGLLLKPLQHVLVLDPCHHVLWVYQKCGRSQHDLSFKGDPNVTMLSQLQQTMRVACLLHFSVAYTVSARECRGPGRSEPSGTHG